MQAWERSLGHFWQLLQRRRRQCPEQVAAHRPDQPETAVAVRHPPRRLTAAADLVEVAALRAPVAPCLVVAHLPEALVASVASLAGIQVVVGTASADSRGTPVVVDSPGTLVAGSRTDNPGSQTCRVVARGVVGGRGRDVDSSQ